VRRVLVVLVIAALVVWRFHLWPRHSPAIEPRPPPPPPPVAAPPAIVPIDAAPPPVDAAPAAITMLAIPIVKVPDGVPVTNLVTALIIVDGRLVWTDSFGSIWTMPVAGGQGRELANQHDGSNFPMYGALAVVHDTVYASRLGAVAKIALPDGPVTDWAVGSDDAYALVSDGSSLYGAMFDGKQIVRFDDGKQTLLARAREVVMTASGSAVYSATFDTGAVAELAPKQRAIARGIPHPTGFAADDHALYVWSQLDNGLRKVDLATGKVTMLWKSDVGAGDPIAADGDWIYADVTTERGTSLVRIAKDGSQLQVLVDELANPAPIAIDADAIYTQAGRDTIVRVDKARVQPLRVVKPATVAP
jgi:DNA-binding beta-propeller fold protein YncE